MHFGKIYSPKVFYISILQIWDLILDKPHYIVNHKSYKTPLKHSDNSMQLKE